MGRVCRVEFSAARAQAAHHTLDLHCISQHGDVGQQAEADCFVHHFFIVADPELGPIGEEQPARERLARFPLVKLALDAATDWLLVDVTQVKKRLARPPNRLLTNG